MSKSVALLLSIFCLAFPAGALAIPVDNGDSGKGTTLPSLSGKETAASILATAIRSYYRSQLGAGGGRGVETQCSGSGSYSCNWWIIKGAKEKILVRPARDGDGNEHSKRGRVFLPGQAQVVDQGRNGWKVIIG